MKNVKLLFTTGDVDPITYGGGVVYKVPGDPTPQYEWWEDATEDEEGDVLVYRTNVEDDVVKDQDWADLGDVARAMDLSVADMKESGKDPDVRRRVLVLESIASYYGSENLDHTPMRMTRGDLTKRWGRAISAHHQHTYEQMALETGEGLRVPDPRRLTTSQRVDLAHAIAAWHGAKNDEKGRGARRESQQLVRKLAKISRVKAKRARGARTVVEATEERPARASGSRAARTGNRAAMLKFFEVMSDYRNPDAPKMSGLKLTIHQLKGNHTIGFDNVRHALYELQQERRRIAPHVRKATLKEFDRSVRELKSVLPPNMRTPLAPVSATRSELVADLQKAYKAQRKPITKEQRKLAALVKKATKAKPAKKPRKVKATKAAKPKHTKAELHALRLANLAKAREARAKKSARKAAKKPRSTSVGGHELPWPRGAKLVWTKKARGKGFTSNLPGVYISKDPKTKEFYLGIGAKHFTRNKNASVVKQAARKVVDDNAEAIREHAKIARLAGQF